MTNRTSGLSMPIPNAMVATTTWEHKNTIEGFTVFVSSQGTKTEIFPWQPTNCFAYLTFENFGSKNSLFWDMAFKKILLRIGDTENGHHIPVFYWRAIVYVLMTCCWHGYRHGNSHSWYRASVAPRSRLPNPSGRNNTLCLKTELTYSVIFWIVYFYSKN